MMASHMQSLQSAPMTAFRFPDFSLNPDYLKSKSWPRTPGCVDWDGSFSDNSPDKFLKLPEDEKI